ncbi:hypothetical protein BKA80DRAFT_286603 [Phyllosticta citrichinensis]
MKYLPVCRRLLFFNFRFPFSCLNLVGVALFYSSRCVFFCLSPFSLSCLYLLRHEHAGMAVCPYACLLAAQLTLAFRNLFFPFLSSSVTFSLSFTRTCQASSCLIP